MKKKSLIFLLIYVMFKNFLYSGETGLVLGVGLIQAYGSKEQAQDYNIDIKNLFGYRAGLYFHKQINDQLNLKQEILFVQKGSKQNIRHKTEPVFLNVKYNLEYLEMPFIIQYSLYKYNNLSLWSDIGFSFSYLLNAKYELDGNVFVGNDIFNLKESYKMKDLDEFDYSLLYGFTFKFPVNELPFFLEYRFSLSWYKINFPTYNNLDSVQLSNQAHSLSIGFPLKLISIKRINL